MASAPHINLGRPGAPLLRTPSGSPAHEDARRIIQPFLRGSITGSFNRKPATVDEYKLAFSRKHPGVIYKVVGIGKTGEDTIALVQIYLSVAAKSVFEAFTGAIPRFGLADAESLILRAVTEANDMKLDPFTPTLFVQVDESNKGAVTTNAMGLHESSESAAGGARKIKKSRETRETRKYRKAKRTRKQRHNRK